MVLEIRPPLETNKGTAVRSLLAARGLRRALYAGDDTTDLDAFRALEELELGVRVGVASAEGPRGIGEAADVVVRSRPSCSSSYARCERRRSPHQSAPATTSAASGTIRIGLKREPGGS